MESSNIKKKIVLMAVSLATGGLIISSLLGVLELAKSPPPPVKASLSSQNAQIAAQENGFLAVLKKEPKNSTAITGMEAGLFHSKQRLEKIKTRASFTLGLSHI